MMPGSIITPDWLLPDNVGVAITTRAWGNLAAHVGDDPAQVLLRRRRLHRQLQLSVAINFLTQQHTAAVSKYPTIQRPSDGVYANRIASCAVLTADCLPLLICSEDGQQIAAVHAGWRGLAAGILTHAIRQFSAPPESLRLFIGPAICQRCFEVGADVVDAFSALGKVAADHFTEGAAADDGSPRWLCDLAGLAQQQAQLAGINHLQQSGQCTACSTDSFYSHRKCKDKGRFASIIWRKR